MERSTQPRPSSFDALWTRIDAGEDETEVFEEFLEQQRAAVLALRSVLEEGDTFTLYALDPSPERWEGGAPAGEVFYDNRIVDEVEVTDPAARAGLVEALYRGIEEHVGSPALCFFPHHGIRATRGGRTVDVLVCFSCGPVRFWEDGVCVGAATTATPRPLFDRTLWLLGSRVPSFLSQPSPPRRAP